MNKNINDDNKNWVNYDHRKIDPLYKIKKTPIINHFKKQYRDDVLNERQNCDHPISPCPQSAEGGNKSDQLTRDLEYWKLNWVVTTTVT